MIFFVFSHPTDVMDTVGWKNMILSHPHLIAEAFRALATQQIPPIGPPRKRVKLSWNSKAPLSVTPASHTTSSSLSSSSSSSLLSANSVPQNNHRDNNHISQSQQPPPNQRTLCGNLFLPLNQSQLESLAANNRRLQPPRRRFHLTIDVPFPREFQPNINNNRSVTSNTNPTTSGTPKVNNVLPGILRSNSIRYVRPSTSNNSTSVLELPQLNSIFGLSSNQSNNHLIANSVRIDRRQRPPPPPFEPQRVPFVTTSTLTDRLVVKTSPPQVSAMVVVVPAPSRSPKWLLYLYTPWKTHTYTL